MKIYLLIIFILCLVIVYLMQKIEKQKIKIITLSRQNTSMLQNYNPKKLSKNFFEGISNVEIKFIKITTQTAILKNTSYIKIAPFDFAPKIVDIQKNTRVKIISKISISNEYWYEIIVNNTDLSYNLKGWVKDYGIEFIYTNNSNLIKSNTSNIF